MMQPLALITDRFPGQLSDLGLTLHEELTFEQWSEIGRALRHMERSVMWWIGDWCRFGERRYGEGYKQVIKETGYAYQTARDAKWVANSFELSRRRDNLPWSYHREVAALPESEQERLLDVAATNEWSQKRLRAEVQRLRNTQAASVGSVRLDCIVVDRLEQLAGHCVGTIYADPPWPYDNHGTRAAANRHYKTMSLEDICALPVRDIVADNAHLHLWTTNAFGHAAMRVMEAWGFEYKSCYVWVKPNLGIGNYWRLSHEFLLFGRRGKAPFLDKGLRSWDECDIGEHSEKPERVRELIEKASPGPWLEMFARRAEAKGWLVWGHLEPTLVGRLATRFAA